MKVFICSICFLVFSPYLDARDLIFKGYKINPDSTILTEDNLHGYTIPDSILNKLPFKNQNNLNRVFPGVVSYFQDFYIRGGESYETGFFIEGMKFNDLLTGKNSFFLNPNTFEKIEFYNGFIPNDFGNVSSGLFNYKLRTGGEKINFEVEHLNDNITFTNNPYSGNKSLGAYYYGHNETNISVGGPLYFPNVRFFANVNYLFQRDKNPQRYPGADNVTFIDDISYNPDSITINLPAGIVPLNSFESFNFLSTLFFDFESIQIKASVIYFDENTFVERNHIDEYLNTRAGLVDKSGGIINVNIHHKLNEALTYSLSGNYSVKNEVTSDQYLGDNYWSYGDSVANANAGVIWQRSERDLMNNYFGRYALPKNKYILGTYFIVDGYPEIDHQKSGQSTISFSGVINYKIQEHQLRIGAEYYQHKLKYWQLNDQRNLAGEFAYFRENPGFSTFSDDELKEYLTKSQGVNNIGYAADGSESKSDLDDSPKPAFYGLYLDDQFRLSHAINIYYGIRYDHFNFDYKRMINQANPELTYDRINFTIDEDQLTEIEDYDYFSPKFALKFLFNPKYSISASYSRDVQSQIFSMVYRSHNSISHQLASGYVSPVVSIGNSKPIVSTKYEINLFFRPFNNLKNKLSVFKKITENLKSINRQITDPASPYSSYFYYGTDRDLNIWGLEYEMNYYISGFSLLTNLNYQNGDINEPYLFDYPYSNNNLNKFQLNLLCSYNFHHLLRYSVIFNSLNLSALYSFNSGHNYSWDIDLRIPYSGYTDAITPNVNQIDLKIEKGFVLFNKVNLDVYLYILNLLDAENIYDVFSSTGLPEDDGYNLARYQEIFGEEKGAKMYQLHKLELTYNPNGGQQTFYGPPRQIGFGIKLNY
jgi:hypothetical protein